MLLASRGFPWLSRLRPSVGPNAACSPNARSKWLAAGLSWLPLAFAWKCLVYKELAKAAWSSLVYKELAGAVCSCLMYKKLVRAACSFLMHKELAAAVCSSQVHKGLELLRAINGAELPAPALSWHLSAEHWRFGRQNVHDGSFPCLWPLSLLPVCQKLVF